ncbi:MAG: ribonuclease PH [Actinomycetota bacterium]
MSEAHTERADGRSPDDLRPITIERNFLDFPAGSCLISFGRTRVVCAATVEQRVPRFLEGRGQGWVTAEYSMLPASTLERSDREAARGRLSGRTQEIQRLIGRSLRAVIDLSKLGPHTITVDCDCLTSDGGTRTASITGGFVALVDAIRSLGLETDPVLDHVAAVSVGIIGTDVCLDLDYPEDVRAEVDMNVVMTGAGNFVEVQGTAEGESFDKATLDRMLAVASDGIAGLIAAQRDALAR